MSLFEFINFFIIPIYIAAILSGFLTLLFRITKSRMQELELLFIALLTLSLVSLAFQLLFFGDAFFFSKY